LILNLDKRYACVLTYWVKPLVFCCCFLFATVFAQDTVLLKNVEISARKIELSQIGKKTMKIDSIVKEQFKYSSLADLLSYNSSIFIKNYGPGSIATTAFRGANASQTAVLWNGFNLQNAMLGQTDLSLMPSMLFEEVSLEYGGSSSLWGSGAIAGSILLNNQHKFNQGSVVAVSISAGSYGALNSSASVLVSKPRWISSTKIYLNSSKNNFKYKDTLDQKNPIKHQKNSEFNFKGLMQELKYLINQRQIISVNAWLNTNYRHLPSTNSLYDSKTFQNDEALRLSANWSYVKSNIKSVIRGGYFMDKIDYTDSLSGLFSKSKVKTWMLENENYFSLHKKYQLNVAANILSSSAITENYSSEKSQSRVSILLGNRFSFFKERFISYLSFRAEYYSVGTLPITGNISLEYKLFKNISAKINMAKVYRQPTLNELYWTPGGNVNLKPEEGYTYEGEINYTKHIQNIKFFISAAAYSRIITNWILWTPGANGNPSPVNIQNVWSRGTETTWKVAYRKNKIHFDAGVITGYCLSTVKANTQLNDNSVNKQLIYTPRYTANTTLSFGYANTDLVFYNQYAGYRFTTSDNLNWLNPYLISSLRVNHNRSIKNINFIFFASCNNLTNRNYTVVAGRPMPLRNYELGITLKIKSKTNK
jgi:vitamin B12 transporter